MGVTTYAYDDKQAKSLYLGAVIKLYNEDDTFSWWEITNIIKNENDVILNVHEHGKNIIKPRELNFEIDRKIVFTVRKPLK